MYHCHLQFYFIGFQRTVFDPLKVLDPLENFSHHFLESSKPQANLAAQANVIFANLTGTQETEALEIVRLLSESKAKDAELILLASRKKAKILIASVYSGACSFDDIWITPLTEQELIFRFGKWQREYKQRKDLWEANYFLDACINSSPNLIWYKSKDGLHTKVNDRFCQTIHKNREDLEGHQNSGIWGSSEKDSDCVQSDQAAIHQGRTYVTNEIIYADGNEKLVTTYKTPLYDLDSSVMGTVGVAVDITREHVCEQQLIEKNQLLERLFETMDCGVLCHTAQGREILKMNQAALDLLGYVSQEEMLEDGFDFIAQSVLDEDKQRVRNCIAALRQPGDSNSVEYRVRHKDGKILHILESVKLIKETGCLFYQRFLLDFTAHKRKDEEQWTQKDQALQYQQQMFQIFCDSMADNIDDVYVMLDSSGNHIEFVTPNIERILGISIEQTDQILEQLDQAKYLTGHLIDRKEFAQLQPGTKLEPMETERIHQKTGECRRFLEYIYCVPFQNDKKLIRYLSDRTEDRKTQKALTEALEMAKVANCTKSTFLSNVSHDIRTPMNAIIGLAALLQGEADQPERVREYAEKISSSSQHLLNLMNNVLDMSKLESGSAILRLSEFNLAEMIEELNHVIHPQAVAKEQSFEIQVAPLQHEYLIGDKERINQILLNILSNAVKYTPSGGCVRLQINELPQVDLNYSRIQFVISDNGRGMSEEYQKLIFEPFTRELNSCLNEIQGAGLGMAITKNLIDLMNGNISVQSKLGEGSRFTVELELHIQERQEDPKFWKHYGISRMLVVDHDENTCQDIVKKMEKSGVVIDYATDSAQAMDLINKSNGKCGCEKEENYNLVLLDWNLPNSDSIQTVHMIREKYADKLPIFIFSDCNWEEIRQEASGAEIEMEAIQLFPKPFFISNFKEIIQKSFKPVPVSDSNSSSQAEKKPEKKEKALAGKRILVVDDIEINRMILVKILTTLGASCDIAENGEEALKKFQKALSPASYDIIMMDIQMPIMNGYESAQAIRDSKHPAARTVLIIATTANAFVDDVRNAFDSGMDAHISKPVILERLLQAVQEAQERRS